MFHRFSPSLGLLVLAGMALSQEPKRETWDQRRALQVVQGVRALEEKGDLPWDSIPWKTDAREAVDLAQKEQKPIFLFFFLKKNSGPAQAPC